MDLRYIWYKMQGNKIKYIDNCQAKVLLISLLRYWWSKNLGSDWPKGTLGHTQPRLVVFNATFTWWLSPYKKTKRSINSFQTYWWWKNPAIWLDERHNWPHQNKGGSLRSYIPLWLNPYKKLKYYLTLSRGLDDLRILLSDWTRGTTGKPNQHKVVPDATFTWWIPPCKKSKRVRDFFQRCWRLKNPTIWLVEKHNWPHSTKKGSLRCYLSLIIISTEKNLRYSLIPFRDIDDQKIPQSDWTRGTTCHN